MKRYEDLNQVGIFSDKIYFYINVIVDFNLWIYGWLSKEFNQSSLGVNKQIKKKKKKEITLRSA